VKGHRAIPGAPKYRGFSMSVARLSVVPAEEIANSSAMRAGRLYAEARAAALEQVRLLEGRLATVAALAAEIAEGGDVYPAGIRDLCRRMSEEITQRAQTLGAVAGRALDPPH
jgi:hypothetical protein